MPSFLFFFDYTPQAGEHTSFMTPIKLVVSKICAMRPNSVPNGPGNMKKLWNRRCLKQKKIHTY